MRAGRLLNLLMLLQTRGRMSAPALAAELEVSVRTVLRDIDGLSLAGVPVWSDRGRNGGFQLREGWSTELTGLTGDEARALVLSGLPDAATELGMGSAAVSARLKMLAALPETFRADAAAVSNRLHIDPVEWYRAEAAPVFLRDVAGAVWRQRAAAIRYESWNGVRDRVVRPLGLVLKAGVWYMAALAEEARREGARAVHGRAEVTAEPRIYRLSSIRGFELRGSFRYPRSFRLGDFWQRSRRRFESDIYTGTATLRVTARGLKLVCEMGAAVAQAARNNVTPETGTDWSRIEIPIESVEHAARTLLAIGRDAEVLGPPELRAAVRALVADLSSRYRRAG